MSDETYKRTEESDERPAVNLGMPEKQPRDLGVHKMVFPGRGHPHDTQTVDLKSPKDPGDSMIIVQEEYSQWESGGDQKQRGIRNRLTIASVICFLFIGLEFAGGFLSNSLVIAADAAQLLTVFSTMMVSMVTLELQSRKSVVLGLNRCEIMAALLSVLTTWVLTSVVLYLAFERIIHGDFVLDVDMMLATSAFGVVANLVMGMTLHNNCHVRQCKADNAISVNVNVRAAFLHIVFDFLFSLAVFITALFIDCCPDWHIVDPISTFAFGVVVLCITLAILKDILNVLNEGTPRGILFNEILKTFLGVDGVQQVQNLKMWAISVDKIALSAHLTVGPGVDYSEVLRVATRRVHAKYDFCEISIHMEALQESPYQERAQQEPVKN